MYALLTEGADFCSTVYSVLHNSGALWNGFKTLLVTYAAKEMSKQMPVNMVMTRWLSLYLALSQHLAIELVLKGLNI